MGSGRAVQASSFQVGSPTEEELLDLPVLHEAHGLWLWPPHPT